jgi:hypothetical protein
LAKAKRGFCADILLDIPAEDGSVTTAIELSEQIIKVPMKDRYFLHGA